LIDLGVVEQVTRGKLILSRAIYEAVGKPGKHTRLRGLDRETNKALLLKHMELGAGKGAKLAEFLQVLPSHSRGQVQALLYELQNEKKAFIVGKNRGAQWFMKTGKEMLETNTKHSSSIL